MACAGISTPLTLAPDCSCRELAKQRGVTLLWNTSAVGVERQGDGQLKVKLLRSASKSSVLLNPPQVKTSERDFITQHVVLCPGSWLAQGLDLLGSHQVVQHVLEMTYGWYKVAHQLLLLYYALQVLSHESIILK